VNHVGTSDGCKTVRNDDDGHLTVKPLNRIEDSIFIFGIERACRFIENEHSRMTQQRASETKSLSLTA